MKALIHTYRYLVLMAVAALMAGCNDAADMPEADDTVDEAVSFSGGVREKGVTSKAGDDDDDEVWLDMSYDTWMWSNGVGPEKVPVDFIIRQDVVVDGTAQTNTAAYRLKPGETNRLVCADGETPLGWLKKDAEHKFRAWTEPKGVTMNAQRESGTVDMTQNNLDYEYFVGAKTEPLTYASHGVTVALKFEHLIGKLIIDNVSLIYSDGVVTQNMMSRVGAIYFPNMPTAGKFDTGVNDDTGMAVTLDENGEKGNFFSLAGNDDYSEYINNMSIPFYVLPMLFDDGNNYGEFYVNFYHPGGYLRRYKGNLSTLVNEANPESSLRGIKAGECLTLHLVLKDDVVEGFYAYVENWIDDNNRPVKVNPYPGIYTFQDLVDNGGFNKNTGKYELKPNEEIVYGVDEDGKKIIRIYDNLDLSVTGLSQLTIVVPDGCVLDGLGHNISGIPNLVIEGDVRNLYVNGI